MLSHLLKETRKEKHSSTGVKMPARPTCQGRVQPAWLNTSPVWPTTSLATRRFQNNNAMGLIGEWMRCSVTVRISLAAEADGEGIIGMDNTYEIRELSIRDEKRIASTVITLMLRKE